MLNLPIRKGPWILTEVAFLGKIHDHGTQLKQYRNYRDRRQRLSVPNTSDTASATRTYGLRIGGRRCRLLEAVAKSPEIEGMGVLVASAGPICYPWSMPQASRHLFDSRPNAAS